MSRPWRRLSLVSAGEFLNLGGAASADPGGPWGHIAEQQLEGAVALFNRLCSQHLVWLGDEVGMGKTFVALAVAALVRHEHPAARILFLLPSSRLQPKWQRELSRFTQHCVKQVDHRARTFQGTPTRPLLQPTNLHDLARGLSIDPDQDVLAPLSAFSFGLQNLEEGDQSAAPWIAQWQKLRAIAPRLPHTPRPEWYRRNGTPDKLAFKRIYAAALNTLLPAFDLVICDEAHNLKAGVASGAARNQTLAAALGGVTRDLPASWHDEIGPVEPKVTRVLCLTATPVERSFAELAGQASVFGMPRPPDQGPSLCPHQTGRDMAALASGPTAGDSKAIATQYIIRRLHQVRIGGDLKTKNQYRREWRNGGMIEHDGRLDQATPVEKLMVALVQKKVIEVLHKTGARDSDGAFLASFQMGMLSSFESFGQSIDKKVAGAGAGVIFEGKDGADADEATSKGKDTGIVDAISESFRRAFSRTPPHPKQNQVARTLADHAIQGEKSLVFVRRVKTTEELASRVSAHMDEALMEMLAREVCPGVRPALESAFVAYRENRRKRNAPVIERSARDRLDTGSNASFFAWYFRGSGDVSPPMQQAAALRRNTLQRKPHPWYSLLHDNHVLWLFGDEPETLSAWVQEHRDALDGWARRFVGANVTRDDDIGDRSIGAGHWFEAWQAAGLEHLSTLTGDPRASLAGWLRRELYPGLRKEVWGGETVGEDDQELLRLPFFARLRQERELRPLWPGSESLPDPTTPCGLSQIRERELRRELMTSQLRLGASGVDVWLALTAATGSVEPPPAAAAQPLYPAAVDNLIGRLKQQASAPAGFSTWMELRELAAHHHLIVGQNFPKVTAEPIHGIARYLQGWLSKQAPVVALHGGSKSEQALLQFRMPGYPLVMVATDVVQEGVDLHTFCKRVVHYGLSSSSAATEQRTGRVDRLGSLAHRVVTDGDPSTQLQVHFPHLRDTIEPLQARVLYHWMNRFMRMVHDELGAIDREKGDVNLGTEMFRGGAYPAPYLEKLKTSFAVRKTAEGDLPDDVSGDALTVVDPRSEWPLRVHKALQAIDPAITEAGETGTVWRGEVWLADQRLSPIKVEGARRQPYEASVRSRRDGSGVYLRMDSPVARVELSYQKLKSLFRRVGSCPGATLTTKMSGKGPAMVVVRMEIPLWPGVKVDGGLKSWLSRLLHLADELERQLNANDLDLPLKGWT